MTVPVTNVKVPPPESLEVRASGDPVAHVLRTPGHDRELALGLLFALHLIESARDVATVTHCGRVGDDSRRNTIDVRAAPGFAFDVEPAREQPRELHDTSRLHEATLLDARGNVLACHRDIDPLNAIDKAIGGWLLQAELRGLTRDPATLVVSGEITEAIRQRAARARVAHVQSALSGSF